MGYHLLQKNFSRLHVTYLASRLSGFFFARVIVGLVYLASNLIGRLYNETESNLPTTGTTISSPQQLSVTWAVPPCDLDESKKKCSKALTDPNEEYEIDEATGKSFLEEKSYDVLLNNAGGNISSSSPVLETQTGKLLSKYH
uniref:Uncharacterized protein n=1 Tax=Glossina brevipalpis TaxID=37001 RepID=A0A1A9WTC6_9MUSC